MKIIKYFFEFIFVILLFVIFKLLGRKNASNFGCFIAKNIGSLFRSNKKIVKNLEIAFPDLCAEEKKKIIKNMWCNIGRTFGEYVFLDEFQKSQNIIKLHGLENIKLINKPTVFISGHFANFELMAMELEKQNLQISAIYRPLNNFFLNPIMEHWRKKYICINQIPKKIPGTKSDGTKQFIKAAMNKKNIAVMVDQSITQGKKIVFFNKDAYTTLIPSQLFLKYNYQIIPLHIERINNHQFNIYIQPPMNLDKTIENEISITKKINIIIEQMICKNPSQWIWTHNRWKS